jgi:hypothetical protein
LSFATVEQALATQLAAVAGFSPEQVSLDDWAPLDRGLNPLLVLGYDGFTNEPSTFDAEYLTTWRIAVNLLVRYQRDDQLHAEMGAFRQAIFDRLSAYPRLGTAEDSGILLSLITDGEPLTKRATGGSLETLQAGNVRYAHEVLRVSVQDEQDYDLSG